MENNTCSLNRDASWLQARAKEIIHKAQVQASDGTDIWLPAGNNQVYCDSTYSRDFYYTVDSYPELFSARQIKAVILFFLKYQDSMGRIPNSVSKEGKAWYWLYDNSMFLVNLVDHYIEQSNDKDFFNIIADKLEKALNWLPVNKDTSLVTMTQPDYAYGFQDSVPMHGDELFTSLLLYEAAVKMERMYLKSDNHTRAQFWDTYSRKIREGLKTLYNEKGFLYAASETNRLPSVWGTLFAFYIGAVEEQQKSAIAKWVMNNIECMVQHGQVRHLVAPLLWEAVNPHIPPHTYQNGAYWALPYIWLDEVVRTVDPDFADVLLGEILTDFQKYGINEVVNYEIDYLNRAGHAGEYCASLIPLKVLRKKGIKFMEGYKNLAAADGAIVSASSVYRDGLDPKYQIWHINDTRYGDSHSWIPHEDDTEPWIKIELLQKSVIDIIIFGRDNWSRGNLADHQAPNRNGLSDRNIEQFEIYISSDGEDWRCPIYQGRNCLGLRAGENYICKLSKPTSGRFLLMKMQPNTACIDELEAYGYPMPS